MATHHRIVAGPLSKNWRSCTIGTRDTMHTVTPRTACYGIKSASHNRPRLRSSLSNAALSTKGITTTVFANEPGHITPSIRARQYSMSHAAALLVPEVTRLVEEDIVPNLPNDFWGIRDCKEVIVVVEVVDKVIGNPLKLRSWVQPVSEASQTMEVVQLYAKHHGTESAGYNREVRCDDDIIAAVVAAMKPLGLDVDVTSQDVVFTYTVDRGYVMENRVDKENVTFLVVKRGL